MQAPIISVVVPVYNAASFLPDLFRSLERQTLGFDRLQVLFADDGSTDESLALLEGFAAGKDNVDVTALGCNHGFAGPARNAALERATAPYVLFLDADDRLPADACALLLQAMQSEEDMDIVTGYYAQVDEKGRDILPISDSFRDTEEGDFDLQKDMAAFFPVGDPFACKLYKNELIRAGGLRYGEDFPGEDGLFLIRYLLLCRKGRYVKQRVYDYRMVDSSVSHKRGIEYYRMLPCYFLQADEALAKAGQTAYSIEILRSLDYYVYHMLKDGVVTDEAAADILAAAWFPVLQRCVAYKVPLNAPAARILAADGARDTADDAAFHLLMLARLAAEREQELQSIFGSTTWKVASRLAKLLGR